jgi:hypothetical protein
MLLDCTTTVPEMIDLGLDLPRNAFQDMVRYGRLLFGTTKSDSNKCGMGTVFASYH